MEKTVKILYEDANLVFCIKPIGVISQSDDASRDNMVDRLRTLTDSDIFPLHRLDADVGGVMVFAKNKNAAAKMSAIVADHSAFVKEYYAIVKGEIAESDVLEDLLYHDRAKNKTYVVKKERNGVKKAKLEYVKVKENGGYSLLKIRLYTGRTHQIRVQFASRGYSLLGDRKYGGEASDRIYLFSHGISFVSPFGNGELSFFAEPEWDI